MMAATSANLIGSGIYSVSEASRLAGVDVRVGRRWFEGHDVRQGDETVHYDPIIRPTHARSLEGAVSFLDLIELRLVAYFRGEGISLQMIRKVAAAAREVLKCTHPFASHRFLTDGRKIAAEIIRRGKEPELVDLLKRQILMRPIVEHAFYTGLEFDERGRAKAWTPPAGRNRVVLDPARQFGAPIVKASAVPTSILFDSFNAEDSNSARVASLYDVRVSDVDAAVAFEQSLLH